MRNVEVAGLRRKTMRRARRLNDIIGAKGWEVQVEPHLTHSPSRADEVGRHHSPVPADLVAATAAHTPPQRPSTAPERYIKAGKDLMRERMKNVKAYLQRQTEDKDTVTAVCPARPD